MTARHVDHLLIGGGLAAATCAETLREEGADGSILLVGREADLPYNRPPASKGYLQGTETHEDTLVHDASWFPQHDVELLTRTTVTALDPAARTATLSNKEEITFGTALLATGAMVNRLNVEGGQLEGLHYLRTLPNSDAIRADAEDGGHIVCIGGSYIGSEVAASLTARGSDVTMVMLEDHPLARTFGDQAGRFFRGVLEGHGVEVLGGEEVERLTGSGERVEAVVTKSGREIPATTVVIGAGVHPDVMLARKAGLEIGELGGVRCDDRLRTSAEGIYAAGDICEYDSVLHGRVMRIEHWDVAHNQGAAAARNMLGRDQAYDVVPYFFSDLSDWVSLEYVGPALEWDDEIVRGSIDDGEFTIFYVQGDRLRGALSVGRSDDLDEARELIKSGAAVDRGALGAK
jgi:3-phenylpropionate/trans-cinnamate dioxygenase ferredoxin reductase component